MTFTASDVLLKAASRIEEDGMWCQGSWHNTDVLSMEDFEKALPLGLIERSPILHAWALRAAGLRVPECLEGALNSAAAELAGDMEQASLLFDEARGLVTKFLSCPITFNDTPGRTAHEVAEAMRQAALQ